MESTPKEICFFKITSQIDRREEGEKRGGREERWERREEEKRGRGWGKSRGGIGRESGDGYKEKMEREEWASRRGNS